METQASILTKMQVAERLGARPESVDLIAPDVVLPTRNSFDAPVACCRCGQVCFDPPGHDKLAGYFCQDCTAALEDARRATLSDGGRAGHE